MPPFASRGPSLGEGRRGWAWIAARPNDAAAGRKRQDPGRSAVWRSARSSHILARAVIMKRWAQEERWTLPLPRGAKRSCEMMKPGDDDDPVPRDVHGDLAVESFIRVSIAIQFTSQVFPPSSENDCSNRSESGVIVETTNRT